MTDRRDMLLLADGPTGNRLATRLGAKRCVRFGDPYEALLEMSRRRWDTIVLTAPRKGFEGICRASRRLQADARLLAVCPPVCEPDVRPLVGKPLDD